MAQDYVPPDRQDIPEAYRGTWSLDPKFCHEPGPASVTIGARTIDFWERHGLLDLAQLNFVTEPPKFYGRFRWAALLRFTDGVVRLELVGSKLAITEAANPDTPRNAMLWSRCD